VDQWDRGRTRVAADLPRQMLLDLPMPRYRRHPLLPRIDVERVAAPLTEETTTLLLEVSDQVPTPHAAATRSGSRITSASSMLCLARSRLASSTITAASRRLLRTSSSVRPCELAPGSSSMNPM
jgi:hypothetical protein